MSRSAGLGGTLLAACLTLGPSSAVGQTGTERARDIGIPLEGTPGDLDAITDVPGVTVGHVTIVRGAGRLEVGKGPVRTGVTAIFPRGRDDLTPVFAGWFNLNGNGEMTGTAWIDDYGLLVYPITITNTNSVGTVRDAVIEWGRTRLQDAFNCCLPVVAETWDGDLSDIYGFHVTKQHAFRAMDSAKPGPVAEGNVGGGTGMICLGFKGGIGTASRKLTERQGGYTVGVLVQCNFGTRRLLRIAGAPVGQEITEPRDCFEGPWVDSSRASERCPAGAARGERDQGSIIVVVATDAPLLPHQLRRVARRAALGIGRMGGIAGAGSGDLFIAFSTASVGTAAERVRSVGMLGDERIDPVYEATVQATEEAIINAMLAAKTMRGADGYVVPALPHDRLRQALRKYGRLGG
ncbi:MAG TPA: P1 family peptidase [Gemmatimonadales bacterium]|jgi:L-aminopeptidase/D-esterase-like protein|nr:P1 family peptidase [Gemmatimonadales bacterium]